MAFCIYTSLYYCWHVMSVITLDYLKNKIISFSRLFRIYSPTFLKTMHTLSVWFKIESLYITTNLSCFALFKEKKEYKWNKKRKRKLSKKKNKGNSLIPYSQIFIFSISTKIWTKSHLLIPCKHKHTCVPLEATLNKTSQKCK